MTTVNETPEQQPRSGQVFVGLAIMLVGFGFLVDRMDVWHINLSYRLWPLFPLAFGLARLIAGPQRTARGRRARGGIWLICVGIWGFISEFRLFGFDYDTSWPLLIVGAGLNMVWRSFEAPRGRRSQEQSHGAP